MNVLVVLHGPVGSNSGEHARALAVSLAGDDVVLAVPPTGEDEANPSGVVHHVEAATGPSLFRDGRGPDLVHAWTPREIVRLAVEPVLDASPGARLVVHLEDDESALFEAATGLAFADAIDEPATRTWPVSLTDPRRAPAFLARARGVSAVVPSLLGEAPASAATAVVRPGYDPKRFFPRPRDAALARRLGLPEGAFVVGYSGNVHAANASEMRSLYLAVALARRGGLGTILLRTGADTVPFLGALEGLRDELAIELGQVSRDELPEILSLADVLVQPGRPGRFNDRRFPSKLPEYLALGRPVVMPAANLGRELVHGEEAWILPVADAPALAAAFERLAGDADLRRRLGEGGARVARERLGWASAGSAVADLYRRVLAN